MNSPVQAYEGSVDLSVNTSVQWIIIFSMPNEVDLLKDPKYVIAHIHKLVDTKE